MPTPTEQADSTDVTTAFDLGRQVGVSETARDASGQRFADGMRLGISLMARIAAGDVELARQLEAVLDGNLH